MALVRNGYKANGEEQRKYLIPENNWEAEFFRWLCENDASFTEVADKWPCTYSSGGESTQGLAATLRFMPISKDDALLHLVEETKAQYRAEYTAIAPASLSAITFARPNNRDRWEILAHDWFETFLKYSGIADDDDSSRLPPDVIRRR